MGGKPTNHLVPTPLPRHSWEGQKWLRTKNWSFFTPFELWDFSTARRSEAPVCRIVRARPKPYTNESTRPQRPWFLHYVERKKNWLCQKSPKIGVKKQDFSTEISGMGVISPKQPGIGMGEARGLCGTNMELSLPAPRKLFRFVWILEKSTFFSAFFGVEELDLLARTSWVTELESVNGHLSGL